MATDSGKFQRLSDAEQAAVAPLAAQFNKWIVSLIETIAAATSDTTDLKTLHALVTAMNTVAALKPTMPLEHFAYQTQGLEQVMCQDSERFILDYAPSIAYVQKMGITAEKWAAHSSELRTKVCEHVEVLGDMCNDYHADLAQMRGTAAAAVGGGSMTGGGGIPDEIKQQILSMLPPAMVAQVSAIPGGIDSLLAQVISQNPALAAMMSGLSGAETAASEQASEQSPLAGIGSLVSSLKSQMGDLPDDATPDQKSAFYLSIARWLGEQAHVSGSIVSTMFDKFEATFKDGLSPAAINGLVARGRGLLAVAGVPKRDTAHVIVRRLVSFIDKMQAETQGSTLTRATVASKVTSLARIACESEGGLEGLFEVAMQSDFLKKLIGGLTGMPIAEITKDPFAKAEAALASISTTPGGGMPSFDMSSLMGLLASSSTPSTDATPHESDWDDEDDDE